MRQSMLLLTGLGLIWACGDEGATQTTQVAEKSATAVENVAQKATAQQKTGGNGGVSDKELALLEPFLTDLREGIREFKPNSVGVCKGQSKSCDEFVGLDAGELADGKYMIRGDFQAPKLSPDGGWTIKFEVDCEITKTSNNSTSKTSKTYSKEYTVKHVQRTEYGYRLSPLYKIESPSSLGEQNCAWSITGQNLDAPVVWKGSYTIPAKQ